MSENRFTEEKRAAGTPDTAQWSPGFGPLLLIVLCGVLLIAAVILGLTTGIGPLFAVPVVLAALGAAFVLMRGRRPKTGAACPHCGRRVSYPPHMSEFDCPSCGRRIEAPAGRDLRRAA
ncbi:MAG TPA: hypothetical protein VEY09_03630 [Pyrinomonadaceae bacterium]|nr:hypothetical protein [Pyrinomonadaceae bacterium]